MGECTNKSVLRGLPEVFTSGRGSDCDIVFCPDGNAPTSLAELPSQAACGPEEAGLPPIDGTGPTPTTFGEPLPAHRLILSLASERFAAQLERWPTEVATNASQAGQPETLATAAATAATPAACQRPQLRVPLDSEAEVPAARAAIRFAYTGDVAGAASSVRDLLEVRRQGAYLQIGGCAAVCDELLEAKVKANAVRPSVDEEGSNKRARIDQDIDKPVALQLYDCEALWPNPSEEPSFANILIHAKSSLVTYFGNALAALNTPLLREQLLSLSAAALEALLGSDDFGTDNESTVLLLLAVWMKANHKSTDAEIRQRLCRTVRLAHLSRPYLSLVLPALAADHEKDPEAPAGWWSGASVVEAACVYSFAIASEREQQTVLPTGASARPFVASLKAPARAQCISPTDGPTYGWSVSKEDLLRAVQGPQSENSPGSVSGSFEQLPQNIVTAWGFGWRLTIQLTGGQATAGLYLDCLLPDALAPPGSRLSKERCVADMTLVPIAARLVVHRRLGTVQNDVQRTYDASDDYAQVGSGWGWDCALPLREAPQLQPQPHQADAADAKVATAATAEPADHLAPWADYLTDSKITGKLTLQRRP